MTHHFSSELLFKLRNKIPIIDLISDLQIPQRQQGEAYRFLCPVCHQYNTGLNPHTNLSRCFSCKRNFNTIDLVQLIKGEDFQWCVRFLIYFYQNFHTPSSPLNSVCERHAPEVVKEMINIARREISANRGGQTNE